MNIKCLINCYFTNRDTVYLFNFIFIYLFDFHFVRFYFSCFYSCLLIQRFLLLKYLITSNQTLINVLSNNLQNKRCIVTSKLNCFIKVI